MPDQCTSMYVEAAKIAAPVLNGQIECPKDMAGVFGVENCKLGQEATDSARKKVDEKILCALFCCCLNTGRNQACVEEALATADKQTGYKSRYKAEVSYNMQFRPPRPMMEKDHYGDLTTQPIRAEFGHLINRAEIEYDPALRRPSGMEGYRFRRPDVVVVKDPTQPPDQSNISQVIEMKFPNDSLSDGQQEDYTRIGGSKSKFKVYRKDDPCKCGDKEQRVSETVPVPVPMPKEVKQPVAKRSASDWAILIGLGVATVGLALLPFDGPAGEAVAGTATAAQWARMFGTAAAF